ncbi:MAG: DUF2868 domain-containing protein [bacterium]
MKLAEIIDLENQLLDDKNLDPVALRKRDRAIGKQLEGQRLDRKQLFLAWLKSMHKRVEPSLGERVESIYSWLKITLIAVGLAAGASTASATLAFDGTNPVNVVHFLAVFVGLQMLLLLFFLLAILPRLFTKFIPGQGGLLKLIRAIGFLLGKGIDRLFSHLPPEKTRTLHSDLGRIRLRHQLYRNIERWLLISLTQRFGVAFNFGAMVVCLYLIVFSDLAFAWNTTLQIQSETFHRIVSSLSTPWAAVFADAVPSQELVEVSRYFRIEGQYRVAGEAARSANPEAVGGWWPFLILSLICYGLLPRLVTFFIATFKYRLTLKTIPLDTAEFDALYDRLTTPIIETRSLEPEAEFGEKQKLEFPLSQVQSTGKTCSIVRWGEIALDGDGAEKMAMQRFGWLCERVLPAGGFDAREDDKTFAVLTANKKDLSPVLVLVESWEAPNKSVLHFLERLRQGNDPKRPLLIGLVDTGGNSALRPPEDEDWRNWQETLANLGDPYLRLESMVVAV